MWEYLLEIGPWGLSPWLPPFSAVRFPANLSSLKFRIFGNHTGFHGDKILYKNLDLAQDFPNKILFYFLWVKMLAKKASEIFRWPEMCPLGKILAQDFEMAAVTKILRRRDISIAPLLSLGDDSKH